MKTFNKLKKWNLTEKKRFEQNQKAWEMTEGKAAKCKHLVKPAIFGSAVKISGSQSLTATSTLDEDSGAYTAVA